MQMHCIHTFVLLHFLSFVFASTLPAYIPSRRDRLSFLHNDSLINARAVNAASTADLIKRDWRTTHRNLFVTTIQIGGGWIAHYNALDFIGGNVHVAVEELADFYHQILELGAIVWANQPPQTQREASLGGITLLFQSNTPVISWEWIQGFLIDTIDQLQRSSGPGAPSVAGSFKMTFVSTLHDIFISAQVKLPWAGAAIAA